MRVRIAVAADAEAVTALINAAFVVEKFFIDGDRVNLEMVRGLLVKGAFLIAEDDTGMSGCVYVERRSDRGYLGLLSVDPARQKNGLADCWWKRLRSIAATATAWPWTFAW